jgi:glucosyl-3-phosphoglycerate synthase
VNALQASRITDTPRLRALTRSAARGVYKACMNVVSFSAHRVLACVSVVIPALNEAQHIAGVVRYAWADPRTAEVIVVDDRSTDETARLASEAGARIVTSDVRGKGSSMRDGVDAALWPYVVFLDGDLSDLAPGIVSRLVAPLRTERADLVKAQFGRSGGRVTELTAKPLIQTFFPELRHVTQPLGGIVAARRSLLERLHFENDYGVDVGLLLDAHMQGAKVLQVEVGSITHEPQSLAALAPMAHQVTRTILDRALRASRFLPALANIRRA